MPPHRVERNTTRSSRAKKGEVKKPLLGTLSRALELPQEVVLNLPLISIIGKGELTIENHKGILEYSATLVRLNTASGVLGIVGRGLVLRQVTSEAIKVVGSIEGTYFITTNA